MKRPPHSLTQTLLTTGHFFAAFLALAFLLYFVIWDGWYQALFTDPWFFDDGYMFLRYAKIFLMGYGESWNIGEGPVYGNTSQLHFLIVLMLTASRAFTENQIINLASFVPFFIFMFWMPWFCSRHSPFWFDKPLHQRYLFWTLAFGPFFYFYTSYTYFAYTGMDTGLSILLNLLCIDALLTYSMWRKKNLASRFYFHAFIVLVFLAYATRPENIVPAGLFGFFWLVWVNRQVREAFIFAIAMGVLVAIDLTWKYFYFGDLFPLAIYSKSAGYLEGFAGASKNHPILTIFYFGIYLYPYLLLHCLCFRKENLKALAIFMAPVIITISYFFTMVTLMNQGARYEYPFIPYVMASSILFFTGFDTFLKHKTRTALSLGIFSVLVAGIYYGDKYSLDMSQYFVKDQVMCEDYILDAPANYPNVRRPGGLEGVGWISEVLHDAPAGTRVVMTEHGMVGARNPHINIIDVIGLHSPYVAHHGFNTEWLFAQQPDMFWGPHFHYTCINRKIFYSDEFWKHYKFYPGIFSWGISLRKDGPHYEELHALVDKKIRKMYPGYTLDNFEKKRDDK